MIRFATGIALVVVGASAGVAFDLWKQNLARFSPDGKIEEAIWLLMQVLLISLGAPGLLLLFWTPATRLLRQFQKGLDRMGDRTFIPGILLAATTLRAMSLVAFPLPMTLDWGIYHKLATVWAETGQYSDGRFPTALFPPGWPFLLSRVYIIFGPNPIAGAIVNLFLGVGVVYLGYRVVRQVFGAAPARWAALVLTGLPSQVLFTNLLCSELLFTFLLLFSLVLVLRQPRNTPAAGLRSFVCGAVLGLASLVRSLTLFYPVVMLALFLTRGHRLRTVALRWAPLLVGIALVVAPWIARNYRLLGRATISTNGGLNFYIGNNPRSGVGFNDPGFAMIGADSATSEADNDRLGYRSGWEYIRRDPLAFVKRGILKVAFMMANDVFESVTAGVAADADQLHPGAIRWWAVAVQSCWYIFLTFATVGLVSFLRNSHLYTPGGWLLLLTIAYWLAVHFVFFGAGRFHFPITPIVSGFAALGLVSTSHTNRM